MRESRQYDLVVFGATGFVGQLVCQAIRQNDQQDDLTWAIAGRSADKLQALAENFAEPSQELPQIIADATDEASLRHLCEQTQVVISTVGPYALHGEPLVRVCAETGTHYCDLTGESPWIRRMIDRYASIAAQSGAYIVHCCGFDSIPSDLGVFYLQQQAQKRWGQPCERVKMRVMAAQGGVSGGTAASGINLIKEAADDQALRQALKDPYLLCPESQQVDAQLHPLIPVQFDKDFQEWVTPFVMADVNARIVLRSNYLQGYAYSPSFQYDEGILTRGGPIGWLVAQGLKLGLDGFVLAAALPPTRSLLESWILPKSGEGPTPTEQRQGFYDLRFVGRTAEGQLLKVKVMGDRDPGYGSTSQIIAQAGICLAKDLDGGKPGGFWTPAALMGQPLVERLQQFAGVAFSVLN